MLELAYTAWDIRAFAHDMGYDGPPFVWDEEHRDQCGFGETELVQKILHNLIGSDLNPLAVMAERIRLAHPHLIMLVTDAKSEEPAAELDTIETDRAGSSGVVSVTN